MAIYDDLVKMMLSNSERESSLEQMRSWLITDYRASIFEDDTGILAYALYKEDQDSVHLRQLSVQRRNRRSGVGRQSMNILFSEVWPRTDCLNRSAGLVQLPVRFTFGSYGLRSTF